MLAIIGGTFDPIHFGHLRPALEICETFDLRECRFIPSAKPPHRWQPEASAKHRLRMVELAIKQYPEFVLDDREQQRQGASYTVDTLRSIRKEIGANESLAMIVGMDAFQSFSSWHDWEKILDIAHLIVSSRPGYDDQGKDSDWVQNRLTTEISDLQNIPSGHVYFCEVTHLDISATFIRKQIHEGHSCAYLMPKKVLKYINKHGLYASWS